MSLSRALAAPSLTAVLLLAAAGCEPAERKVPPAAVPEVPPAAAPEVEPAAPVREVPSLELRDRLVGWWLRHDQSYMIVLDAIDEDGRAQARYLNPQPVHVSKAEVWTEQDGVRLFLELTDTKYPGSYYELAYDPERDLWIGLYHHLGIGQVFEVYFVRFE